MKSPDSAVFPWRFAGLFFVLYLCTGSWGIRSSDGEIVYRAAESLARRGTFAVARGSRWEGFGLATGTDGRLYPIFAPLPSLVLAPWIWATDRLWPATDVPGCATEWAPDAARSDGVPAWDVANPTLGGLKPARSLWLEDDAPPSAYWRRMVAGPSQALISAALVAVFHQIVAALTASAFAAGGAALLLGLGTLVWPYSGLCFSEPLAMLLVLLSLRAWVSREPPVSRQPLVSRQIEVGANRETMAARELATTCKPIPAEQGVAQSAPGCEPDGAARNPATADLRAAFASGLWLGLASTAHLTSLLFIPFWALLIGGESASAAATRPGPREPGTGSWRRDCPDETTVSEEPGERWFPNDGVPGRFPLGTSAMPVARAVGKVLCAFLAGLALSLPALGLLQFLRFGDPLETGRTLSPEAIRRFSYGVWAFRWEHVYGLLFSAGKGLLIFCPLLIGALLCWKNLWRCRPWLAAAIASAAVFRVLFIAARSDWHGGFSLGPRYLLLLVPLLMIGLGCGLAEALKTRRRLVLAGILVLGSVAALQQWYFCSGDIIQYSRAVREFYRASGNDLRDLVGIYDDWATTPLLNLHQGRRVIWAAGWWPGSNFSLWLAGSCLLLCGIAWLALSCRRRER